MPGPSKIGETPLTIAFVVVAIASAISLIALPRETEPSYTPLLRLKQSDIDKTLSASAELARKTPTSSESKALQSLFKEQGLSESGRLTHQNLRAVASKRRKVFRKTVEALIAKSGNDALAALRAKALQPLEQLMATTENSKQRDALLGSFPLMLERYGLVRNAKVIAPFFVIRTLYKARWNFIHSLKATDGFNRVESQAYQGWLALQARDAPLELRLGAAEAFDALHGLDREEALGALLFKAGHYERAAQQFERSWQASQSIRLRNHMLAARAKSN
ncbi:MAG: hypothetical protein IPJ88_02315 [Myxococcales bacterium]|nr:MAG: hypothetical protein IPJ88_02315 [Myxococcales bacterium]